MISYHNNSVFAFLRNLAIAVLLAAVVVACGSEDSSSSSSTEASATESTNNEPASGSPESAPESESESTSEPESEPAPEPVSVVPGDVVVRDSVRQFTFNHSLWQHTTPEHINAVTGYWVGEFAIANGTTYAWNGQFGQLDYHGLPPFPQLGSDNSEDVFAAEDASLFANEVIIDNVLIMPPNFVQSGGEQVSNEFITYAQRVIDYLLDTSEGGGNKVGLPIYIYEHWPEAASDNLSGSAWDAYHAFTTGSYHNWFINYQNALLSVYPQVDFRMIPVGPIIAEILQNSALQASSLSFAEMYDDSAPHGRPNTYFLAGLITYQAMYGQQVSNSYLPPIDAYGGVSAAIANDFPALNAFVWERLNYYNNNGVRIWPAE